VWDKAHRAMMDVFDCATFEDLVEQEQASHEHKVIDYAI
jgi:hypothetical protein